MVGDLLSMYAMQLPCCDSLLLDNILPDEAQRHC